MRPSKNPAYRSCFYDVTQLLALHEIEKPRSSIPKDRWRPAVLLRFRKAERRRMMAGFACSPGLEA